MAASAANMDMPYLHIKGEVKYRFSSTFNHFLSDLLYSLSNVVPGKLLNMLPTGCPHVLASLLTGNEVADCLVELFFRIDEKARSAMGDCFCRTPCIRRNNRFGCCHRFQGNNSQCFSIGQKDEKAAVLINLCQLLTKFWS